MAKRTLGSLEVGSIVKINENGIPVEFYVAKHDYEASLNGSGRTLLVRKDCYDARKWSNERGAPGNNKFKGSTIQNWLNDGYLALFEPDIVEAIGTTSFLGVTGANVIETYSYPVFLLSVPELGDSTSGDGTELPIASQLVIAYYQGNAVNQWTRSAYKWSSNTVYSFSSDGKRSSEIVTETKGIYSRPAFTLPATIGVLDDGTVSDNAPPEFSCDLANETNLGIQNNGFEINYSVSDIEEDTVTVSEYLDGVLKRTFSVNQGEQYTVECVRPENYQTVLNGSHTIKIVANDGRSDSVHIVSFTKHITSASITLKYPLDADDAIQVAVMSITGIIPEDAELQILLTNNAKDELPAWEDATEAIRAGENYVFSNQTAVNGYAFNFMIAVNRGESDVGGYISVIGGAFQ